MTECSDCDCIVEDPHDEHGCSGDAILDPEFFAKETEVVNG